MMQKPWEQNFRFGLNSIATTAPIRGDSEIEVTLEQKELA